MSVQRDRRYIPRATRRRRNFCESCYRCGREAEPLHARKTAAHSLGCSSTSRTPAETFSTFWFFKDGYGGTVTVEGGRSNACFLIYKDALPGYLIRAETAWSDPDRPGLQTRDFGLSVAIGDAAGMIDPFCGEGMRHALDTGMRAASVVAEGLKRVENRTTAMRVSLRTGGRSDSGAGKRRLGRFLRAMLKHPRIVRRGLWRLGTLSTGSANFGIDHSV